MKNPATFRRITYHIYDRDQFVGSVIFQSGPVNPTWVVHRVRGEVPVSSYDTGPQVREKLTDAGLSWRRGTITHYRHER